MIIAGTGHRPNKLNNEYDYIGPCSDYIRSELHKYFEKHHIIKVISGMALGFDTLLAIVAIDRKIPVLAALPFLGQESRWPEKSKKYYQEILKNPLVTSHLVCPGGYSYEKMQIRNEFMVDKSDEIISCWNGTKGGTYNCIKYAESKIKPITNINPDKYYNPTLSKPTQDSLF